MSQRRAFFTIVPIAAVVNIVLGILDQALHLPIFLDAVGTAVAALVLGPWGGILAGIIGQLVTAFAFHPVALFFTPVNVATAIVWGIGGRLGLARTWPRAFLLGVAVALAASIVTAPTVVAVFGGASPGIAGFLTFALTASGMGVLAAAFVSNVGWSLLDKVLSTFLALAIVRALARARLLPQAAAGGS